MIEVVSAECRCKPLPLFTLRFRFKNMMIFSCGFGTRGDNPRGGEKKCVENAAGIFFKGDFYFLFFFSLRESWVAQHLKAPMYLPEHHHQGAERHFQPSKSSLALWRSLSLPKEIIIVLCYITAPGCTSWWLF